MTVIAHDSAGELAADVAVRFLELVERLQSEGREPQIALTGGGIADEIHREIARLAPDAGVDWDRVVFWFGDERFVDRDSSDRNAGQARAALLDVVGAARVHEMPASDAGLSLDEAATAYAEELRTEGDGHFDLVFLGLGPDGHVASLFPGRPEVEADRIAVGVTDSPKPPPLRISLTLPALNRAERVWFVVSGEEKADAADRALGGDESLPAARVHGRSETLWFRA